MKTFGDWVRALYDGRVSFEEFTRATRPAWERLARMVMRRWVQPVWVSVEDVTQDLLAAVWECIWGWDPKGASIDRYVVFNAVSAAKRRAHRARGAPLHGSRSDMAPSRVERSLSSFDEEFESALLQELVTEPEQEAWVAARERVAGVWKVCETLDEVIVFGALLETGSLVMAAERLYDDAGVRLAYRLGSPARAGRLVVEAARRIAGRVDLRGEA